MSDWIRCRRSMPCKVCGGISWCSISSDGMVVHCMRSESEKPVQSGGWIHKLHSPAPIMEYLRKTAKKETKRLSPDEITKLANGMFEDSRAGDKRRSLASTLGVFDWALEWLHVGYGKDHRGEFASFPARDEVGQIIGITRRYNDGSKMTYPGTSNSGLFYEPNWFANRGSLLIVEGGSDVAACVSERLAAIGRPSNIGGANRIAKMIHAAKWRQGVVVVGERDSKPEKRGTVPGCTKTCRGCMACYPGSYGAKKVTMELGSLGVRAIIKMPQSAKDAREMHNIQELRSWAD